MPENINKAHRLTIGASQVSKIMSYLQYDNLPNGAVSLVETMCSGSDEDLENAYELNTPAIHWGRDHEVEAAELIAAEFEAEAGFYGDKQLRLFAGHEYSNIVSALCDAHLILPDGSIVIAEIKCLDTKNHDYIIAAVGDSAEALKREDWAKYCQVHTQNICAEVYYEKPVSSIIVFYDPRSTAIQLHYVIVVDAGDTETIDHEFRSKLKQRAMLARNLYDSIKAEPDRAAVIYDGVMPETKLVKAAGFGVTEELLQQGIEIIARKAAESVGVEVVDLVIENDKVLSYHLKGGEVFDCETQAGRAYSENLEKSIKKIIPLVKKLNAPLREAALAEHRKYTKTDRLIEALIMPIVNHVGAKRAEWNTEQKRIQDEILATEAEKKRLAEEKVEQVRQAILAKIEIFTVSAHDVSSLELIAAKRLHIESVVIDIMFGDLEQQATEEKAYALDYLLRKESELKLAIEEAEKTTRLNIFNGFKLKCEALHDDTHSFEYLESQLARLRAFDSPTDEYEELANDLQRLTIGNLIESLIPAAKQRAIDLAEKLKAEAEAEQKIKANEVKPVPAMAFISKPVTVEAPAPIVPVINKSDAPAIIQRIERENSLEYDIIAMYAAMNPVLHAKVVEAAGRVMAFQNTPQNRRSSFLHNFFDSNKEGKALRAAFCHLTK